MPSVTVAAALAYAAPVAHAVLGLQVDEVAARPRWWTDGPRQHVGMSAAARDEVHALLDDREAGR